MKGVLKWLYIDRSVEEIIFSCILIAGIPYFLINEIVDLYTNQNLIIGIINITLLLTVIYLLRLSIKRKLRSYHIFSFSLLLSTAFAFFWPSSTGLEGAGAYVLQTLIVVLLLINRGWSSLFFAVYAVVIIGVAGFADINYTGAIVYKSQLISFTVNMLAIALVMNIFKIALDRERRKLIFRVNKLDKLNAEIAEKNDTLEKNHEEIIRIQTQLQQIIEKRTVEIEKENERIVNYAFINAHLVRAPLSNMLGLLQLMDMKDQEVKKLKDRVERLDQVVRKISGVLTIKK
ncbi:hypothetical protein [Ekhidna sp.]